MKVKNGKAVAAALSCLAVAASLAAVVGCGGTGQPKVMVFLGKSSSSYEEMKPVVEKLEKEYGDKVIWVNVDYDDPANKGELEKYSVSMNPTVIIFNTEGKIKQTFMGAAREDMLSMAIDSYIPSKTPATGSAPGMDTTTPATPVEPSPAEPLPVVPNQ